MHYKVGLLRGFLSNSSDNSNLLINRRWIRDTLASQNGSHCPICRRRANIDDICNKEPVTASDSTEKNQFEIRVNELENLISEFLVLE